MEDRTQDRQDAPYLPGILAAVLRGATVLTLGRRAANRLARQVDEAAVQHGQQSWRAARILPWTAWVGAHWDSVLLHGIDARVVLNHAQEVTLWQRVLLEDGADTEQSTWMQAELCVKTSRLLDSYGAAKIFMRRGSAGGTSSDAALFHRWYGRFQQHCSGEGYLPASAIEAELSSLVRQRRVRTDPEVVLFGIPNLLPARQQLLEALREDGTVIGACDNHSAVATTLPQYLHYADREAELQGCVQWVRDRLTQAPTQTVRIVVPDLANTRATLERELRMAVSPGATDVLNAASAAYEIAAGVPVQSIPLVRAAVLLLQWCTKPLSLEDVGSLLRSRHLSLTESAENGALLEIDTLQRKAPLRKELTLQRASELLRPHPVSQLLLTLHRQASGLQSSSAYAEFAGRASALLQASGWPGSEMLDAEESQAVEAWQRALDAMASLDLFGQPTTWTAFLQSLQMQIASLTFVPGEYDLPVQVTGADETLDSPADALWFLHAEANTWPTHLAPNPLLPLSLQREFTMPGVDSQRDEDAAAARLQQLLHSAAGEIRLSCSGDADQDGGRPSPVAERVLSGMGISLTNVAQTSEPQDRSTYVETFFDTTPLPALPEADVAGGVSILTAQAQCGFRAWAEKRLFASPLEEADAGLSPRERGDQVHAVLQLFWAATGSQHALRAKRADIGADGLSERDRLLRACIATVCATGQAESWDEAYLSVQQQRLFRLVAAWLDYEESRPPFEVVQLEQETKSVPVGPLKLHMRVDRIDRVLAAADNTDDELGTLLIDYKTGSKAHSPRAWSGERPEQPQLPAYATAAAISAELGALNGIAFASVRPGTANMHLKGLAEPGLLPPGRQNNEISFSLQKEAWRHHLEGLAQAFADGSATVSPKTYPKTCDTCGQRLLCRLDAATLLEVDGDAWDIADPEAE